MEATVKYLDGTAFEIEARGHKVISDQPVDNGGADGGMTPPELMLASLGSCAGFYAAQYLRARSLSAAGLTVRVEAEKATQPARLGLFRIHVEAPVADEPRHRDGLLRAVKTCLVHNTLTHTPQVEVELGMLPSPAIAA
jgi:putative redox protein